MTGLGLASASGDARLSLLLFELDGDRFALPVARVARTLRAVALTPLPGAPSFVPGVVDVAGTVVPAIDLRVRLGRPTRPIRLSDQLVLADTGKRSVALLVDAATDVVEADADDLAEGSAILPGLGLVDGALMLPSGVILISALGRLLSLDDEAALDEALQAAADATGPDGAPVDA